MDAVSVAWAKLVAYKNSPDYTRRLIAAIAQRATLRTKWSAL